VCVCVFFFTENRAFLCIVTEKENSFVVVR
jgi:hypothetical protein